MLAPLEHHDPFPEAGLRELLPHGLLLCLLVLLVLPGVLPGGLMALVETVVRSL